MKTRNRLTILIALTTISIITLQLALVGLVYAPTIPIGDPTFKQQNGYDSNPTAGLLVGAPTGGFTPTTAGAPLARDGDTTGTNVNWRIGGGAQGVTIAVQQSAFETTPPGGTFTIGWVDIKVSYRATATVNDRYGINYTTRAAPGVNDWVTLQPWIGGASAKFTHDGTTDQRAWSKVAEPIDGVWDWTDITNLKVRAETRRTDATEDATTNRFYLYEVWATIYKGTYPPAGPGVSIQPQNMSGLAAGDSFYVDVFVTNVVTMHGFGFVIRYNPYVLTANEYFDYNPFYTASPSEVSEWTYLYVRYFDNARAGWTGVGTSPYLSRDDYPDNYVYTTTDGDTIGDFYFSSLTSPNYGRTLNIELMAAGDGDDQVQLWLNDGTAGAPWQLIDTVTPPAGPLDPASTPWTTSIDVGKILDTQAKINTAKVYLVKKTVDTEGEMDVDSMRFKVASGYASVSYSSWMGDPVGFTGSGPVARIYFTVDVNAWSPLHFDKATLSSVLGDAILPNYVTDGLYIGPRWLSAVDNPSTLNPIIIPTGSPIGTNWHEIFPQYSRTSVMSSWIDNADGYLSASDQIDMTYDDDPGKIQYYHVDAVTTTIHWTFKPDGVTMDPKLPGAAESETPTTELPIDPIGTRWHQIYPPESFCRTFQITSWTDNGNGHFDPSDQFDFEYDDTPGVTQWAHLDAVSTDIILTWKYETGGPIPEFPLGIGIVLALAPLAPIIYKLRMRPKKRVT